MSTDTERIDEGTGTSVLETWSEWYHVPVIGIVMAFMVWVRTLEYEQFVGPGGTPTLSAIDSWYHWRSIQWTAENYPWTMPYEVWTGFPTGTYVGQFGTLFDQLVATAATIVGLGDPSTGTLYTVALLAIPVMAALVAVPVFFMGRRLGGTVAGLVSVLVLALAPGTFLYRSTAGQLDHHVGEVLFMAIAVLAMMVAVTVAERERPVYELVVDRDRDALRAPTIYAALAGLALSLYLLVWPSGVVLVGIFGVFFLVQLSIDYLRGVSPDHVAFAGVVSMGVAAVVLALFVDTWVFNPTEFSLLQPILAALIAVGCAFMAWLARQWNRREIDRGLYPVAIGGLLLAGVVFVWLAVPDLFDTIVTNLYRRLLPLGEHTTDATIAEAQPPEDYTQHVFDEFGTAFYTMLAGLAVLVAMPLFGRELRAEHTLVVVWSLFLISMSMTQSRFAYYLILAVAVVNAAFVGEVVRLVDLEGSVERLRDVQTYQVIVLVLVAMLLFAPLLPPIANATAIETGESAAPSPDAQTWQDSNHWLANNTPEPGNYGGADNASELDYYGTYDRPADGDFDYPEGSYGVMSWWDYGHLITVQGERIPHANPFQQHATSASAYLTAQSEERAELILEAIAAGEDVAGQSTEQLEEAVANAEEADEEIRYVMIDHEMAGGKFSPITRWSGPDYGSYLEEGQFASGENTTETLPTTNGDYYNTTLASLYLQDASGMDHYRLVHETDEYAVVANLATPGQGGNLQGVPQRSFTLDQLGMDPSWNEDTGNFSTQLRQSRFFNQMTRLGTSYLYDGHVTSTVKTFERVEGATIAGAIDDADAIDVENATVSASVELETAPGRTFTYSQDADLAADGSFELTVPYATTDELGPEDGHTNSSVEATGDYEVSVSVSGDQPGYEGSLEVTESAVIDGETVEVDLEQSEPEGNESGNETAGDETGTDGSDGDGGDGETGNETAGAESLVRPLPEPAG